MKKSRMLLMLAVLAVGCQGNASWETRLIPPDAKEIKAYVYGAQSDCYLSVPLANGDVLRWAVTRAAYCEALLVASIPTAPDSVSADPESTFFYIYGNKVYDSERTTK